MDGRVFEVMLKKWVVGLWVEQTGCGYCTIAGLCKPEPRIWYSITGGEFLK